MFSITGKPAIVTGAASGIGLAISRRFLAAGAPVLMVDRRADGVAIAAEIGAEFFQADVSVEDQVHAMLQAARDRFGSVSILVNNAGIQPLGVPFAALTQSVIDRTLAVNVHSLVFALKHAGLLADNGRVINMASFVGSIATPAASIYAASKAAVIHLTRLGAIELAPRGITVNAVSPGTVRTPAVTGIPDNPEIPFIERRTPLRRLCEPEEVAALCHFLASDEAAYITGQNIGIDGGLTAGWAAYDLPTPPNIENGIWIDDRACA
jgi:NAD(P)-dependent dehydrogenase (short-subunit alcohol dehydrogenase family)